MAQYLDKDALVSEIESKKKYAQTLGNNAINSSMQQFYDGMKQGCVDILSFINTLEVKEVDLHLAYHDFLESHKTTGYMLYEVAEHFYLLGLKAQKGETV